MSKKLTLIIPDDAYAVTVVCIGKQISNIGFSIDESTKTLDVCDKISQTIKQSKLFNATKEALT